MEPTEKLLREFVQHLLREKIRSKFFDLAEFKRCQTAQMCIDYAQMSDLTDLSAGSSRHTFLLSSGKVLKIALPRKEEAGRAQNEAEVEIYTDPKTKPLVTKVFDYDSKYKWIISELVRPLKESTADQEFTRMLGVDFDTIKFVINMMQLKVDYTVKLNPQELKAVQSPKVQQFISSFMSLIQHNNVGISDMENAGHWGKTADGRLVLLDYGATDEVLQKHYSSNWLGGNDQTAVAAEGVMISEKIRADHQFNLNTFKKLKEPVAMSAYCYDVLQPLGEGSSREAWVLSSSKVLKIARPDAEERGRAQNKAEVNIYANSATQHLVAKIFDHDPNYNWLISELVRPLSSAEFKSRFGMKAETFDTFIKEALKQGISFVDFIKKQKKVGRFFTPEGIKWAQEVMDVAGPNDMVIGDLTIPDHWGKTANGRIVLLDYGFTSEVWNTLWHKPDSSSSSSSSG